MITIPDEVKEILVGILLGDGCIVLVMFIATYFLLDININFKENLELTLMLTPLLTPIFVYSAAKAAEKPQF